MSRKVKFTPPARAQFLLALAYIQADRPSAALGFKERANHDLSRLIEFPGSEPVGG